MKILKKSPISAYNNKIILQLHSLINRRDTPFILIIIAEDENRVS